MTRKALLIAVIATATLMFCDKKEPKIEESTEHLDNYYKKNDDDLNSNSVDDQQQDIIDQPTGIFNVSDKVLEFKASTESQFNDVCIADLRYLRSPLCKDIPDFEKCCATVENEAIKKTNAPVKRDGQALNIKLKNGKSITLKNKIGEAGDNAEEFVLFVFSDFIPSLNLVAVDVFYYEGGETYLFDLESGEKLTVVGDVNVSPDGKTLVSYSCDLMSGFRSNGIQIIERNEDTKKLNITLSFEVSKFGPEQVCWQDNKTLIIKQLMVNENMETFYQYATMRLLEAI
ncbi:MAG: hypothetical protein SNJ77_05380 [Cytophagales bacterium]